MITILIDTFLARKAWKRGWGRLALLPLVVGYGLAFVLGLIAGFTGSDIDSIMLPVFLIEIAILISLGVMASRDRQMTPPSLVHEGETAIDQSYS